MESHSPKFRTLYYGYTQSGKIKIDRAKIKTEELLDGKYLLTTSDDSLSAEAVALGYKQLRELLLERQTHL
jgi:hypothetical protein